MSHQPHDRGRDRIPIVIIAALSLVLAFGGGYLLANSGSNDAQPSGPPSTSPASPTSASGSPEPTKSPTSRPSVEPAGDLGDGRYFVYAKKVEGGEEGPLLLTFDLAYLYTGDEANQIAASRGDEVPVPNDVYIVNDNPKTRRYPIASAVLVRYIPNGSVLKPGDIGAFSQAVNRTAPTDYPDMRYTGWWIVITNGEIRSIKQQYLP